MIERAKNTDLDELVSLWQEISLNEFSSYIGIDNVNYFIESGELKSETERLLDTTYVLRKSGEIIGFIVLIENLIELLIVRPKYQNRFVGGKLYRFALDHISKNYPSVNVECFENNMRINSILKRLGFKLTESYKDDMGFITNKYIRDYGANN